MKTLTEFAAATLKNAAQKKQECVAAGKTPEELPAAMGEALKLEGDKLTFLLAALEVVGEKMHDLKRVVVAALNEGESAPSSARLVGEKYYTAEYYPPVRKAGAPSPDESRDRGGRGGRDGKGRGGKGGGKGGRGGGDRDRGGAGGGGGRGGDRDRGGAGGGRGPRAPMAAHAPAGAPGAKVVVKPLTPSVPKAESKPESTS